MINAPTIIRPEQIEADVRLAAAERLLAHGLMSADVYSLDECAAQALTLTAQARRFLSVAA